MEALKGLRSVLIKVGKSVWTLVCVCLHVSVGGSYQLSICSVSIGEGGKTRVMKEEIDENGERQQEKKRRDRR